MRAYFKLPKNEKKLFLEALRSVYWHKIILIIYSFKRCSEKMKSTGTITDYSQEELRLIRDAIRRANKLTFWKNKCLVNTLSARKILNKRNIHSEAFLGIRKDEKDDSFAAHAWIISNEIYIVPIEMEYTTVHTF